MHHLFAIHTFMALAIANPMPQSVTSALSPQQTSCSSSTSGTFQIQTVDAANPQTQRDITARQLAPGALTLTLADGVLKDQAGRTGYIAANEQLQFDNPIPAGALDTAGWSACGDDLALGTSTTFYQCLSGDLYNLYAETQGAQCGAVYIRMVNPGSGGASQISDGAAPTATT